MGGLSVFRRCAFVYLGGMGAVRWSGRLAGTACVGCGGAFLWAAVQFNRFNVALVAGVLGLAVLFALGTRVVMLHSVVVTPLGWMLVPIFGRAKFMAPVADVYECGDDVVTLGLDGQTTVLGIDDFPFRKRTDLRRWLVETLRHKGRA